MPEDKNILIYILESQKVGLNKDQQKIFEYFKLNEITMIILTIIIFLSMFFDWMTPIEWKIITLIGLLYFLVIMTFFLEKESVFKKIFESFKSNEISIIVLAIIIISLLFSFWKNPIGWKFITLIVLLVPLYIMTFFLDHESTKNYKQNYNSYISDLDTLLDTLKKDFNLQRKEEIKILIELCNEKLSTKSISIRFSVFFDRVVLNMFLPIFTFIIGMIANDLASKDKALLIFIIIYVVIFTTVIFYFINFMVENIFDIQRKKIKSLRSKLIDITLTKFPKKYSEKETTD